MSSYEEGYWDGEDPCHYDWDWDYLASTETSSPREVFDKTKIAPRTDRADDAAEESSSIDSSGSYQCQKSKALKTTETCTPSSLSQIEPAVADPATQETNIECPICFENVTLADTITSQCGHPFCGKCLTVWLKMKESCPICQQKVTIASTVPWELFKKAAFEKN